MSEPLLAFDDVTIQYETADGPVTAVSDATFAIREGEYFGLVGESGCGKSTIAKAVIGGLDDNGAVTSGSIRYRGADIHDVSEAELNREVRWTEISFIPQSSMNSLDPLQRISEQAVDLASVHTDMPAAEARERIEKLFDIVGLPPERVSDYPFEFSGGMQQRAVVAMALLLEPSLVLADEPTTALDVIMQDQIFKYFERANKELQTSMVLITHDISLVFESCRRMAVMHGGQLAEVGTIADLYHDPRHPYAILLQQAHPDIENRDQDLYEIPGNPPQYHGDVTECSFVERCPWAVEECRDGAPALEAAGNSANDHEAACVRKDEALEREAARELEERRSDD
jgi:oligopeptide/dipeptide ABC transporter ATP-binding protein